MFPTSLDAQRTNGQRMGDSYCWGIGSLLGILPYYILSLLKSNSTAQEASPTENARKHNFPINLAPFRRKRAREFNLRHAPAIQWIQWIWMDKILSTNALPKYPASGANTLNPQVWIAWRANDLPRLYNEELSMLKTGTQLEQGASRCNSMNPEPRTY